MTSQSKTKTFRGPSLLARAIQYLSRREYSQIELKKKLKPYAQSDEELEVVLAKLKKENWQSDERFTHSFIDQKSSKWGTDRIIRELKTHHPDVDLTTLRESLKSTEADRAYQVWSKKFKNQLPSSPSEYAKQARFMISRGFSPQIISQLLKGHLDEIEITEYPED